MVEYVVSYAKEHKSKTIRIDTWSQNIPAQTLYKKCGFKLTGQQHVLHMGLIPEELVYLDLKL